MNHSNTTAPRRATGKSLSFEITRELIKAGIHRFMANPPAAPITRRCDNPRHSGNTLRTQKGRA